MSNDPNIPPVISPTPRRLDRASLGLGFATGFVLAALIAAGIFITRHESWVHRPPYELTVRRESSVAGENYIGFVRNHLDRTVRVTVRMSYSQMPIGSKDETQSKFIGPNSIETFKFRIWPSQEFESMNVIEAR